jgi:sugar phosphate isomerase/epimerase
MTTFAICTSPWPAEEPLKRLFAAAAAHGISGVELLGEPELDLRDQARTATAHGLRLTALTAAGRLATGRDLGHPDASVRSRTRDHYRACIDVAADIGAPVVGVAPMAVGRAQPLAKPADERAWIADAILALEEEARPAGVRLALEVLNRYVACHANTVAGALELIERTDAAVVGVCVDLFHANIEERDPWDWTTALGPRLVNVHVADSNRLGVGHGHIDFGELMRALQQAQYQGPLAMEAVPSPGAVEGAGGSPLPLLRGYLREFRPRLEQAWTHPLDPSSA